MKRSLGRIWGRAACAAACLLVSGGGAIAQQPAQHWQATPDYPSNYPPNYQPSPGSAAPPATGNPANAAPATGQYQSPQQPDQPVGPPQYPTIEPHQPAPAGQPPYPNQSPDNRGAYPPQDSRPQSAVGQGPPSAGQPAPGQPIQGPPQRNARPQAPFVLAPQEAAALENLLADWEKRDKEIHDLESDVYRWKYDAVFNEGKPPTAEKGVLKFSAPDKGLMRIDAKDPAMSEQWVCDGKSIFQFDYSKKLVTEFVMPKELQGKGIGDGPLPFVFGVEAQKLKQRYFMRIITPRSVQDAVWLEAYPRFQQQAAEFSKVEVILQIGPKRELSPFAIQIYSPNGKDRTVYQLQNSKINPPGTWFPGISPNWWKPSISWGWKTKTELPPPPIEIGLKPSMPRQ